MDIPCLVLATALLQRSSGGVRAVSARPQRQARSNTLQSASNRFPTDIQSASDLLRKGGQLLVGRTGKTPIFIIQGDPGFLRDSNEPPTKAHPDAVTTRDNRALLVTMTDNDD